MQITHEEARKLIHLDSDRALNSSQRTTLSAHIQDCARCREYAVEIKEVESILLPVMKRQWSVDPIPLSTHVLFEKNKSGLQSSIFLTTRTALVAFVFVAFVFSAWQFMISRAQTYGTLPVSVLPVPTPSTQSTRTSLATGNCRAIPYTVQSNDTLAKIASQFSLSKKEIMDFNHLKTETVTTATQLLIPVCNFTPTGTLDAVTHTTTYTPFINPRTSTPDG